MLGHDKTPSFKPKIESLTNARASAIPKEDVTFAPPEHNFRKRIFLCRILKAQHQLLYDEKGVVEKKMEVLEKNRLN